MEGQNCKDEGQKPHRVRHLIGNRQRFYEHQELKYKDECEYLVLKSRVTHTALCPIVDSWCDDSYSSALSGNQ